LFESGKGSGNEGNGRESELLSYRREIPDDGIALETARRGEPEKRVKKTRQVGSLVNFINKKRA